MVWQTHERFSRANPEDFISFRGQFPFAIHGHPKGQATIEALKLDQRSLPEARLEHLQPLKLLNDILQIAAQQPSNTELQKLAKEAQMLLNQAMQDKAEFAAAVRAAQRTNFRYVISPSP